MSFTNLHLRPMDSIIYKEVSIKSHPRISEFHLIIQKSSIWVARVLKFGIYLPINSDSRRYRCSVQGFVLVETSIDGSLKIVDICRRSPSLEALVLKATNLNTHYSSYCTVASEISFRLEFTFCGCSGRNPISLATVPVQ